MCRLTAILASVMLLLASFVGPLFHLHEANRQEHEATGQHVHSADIHTHLAIHLASRGEKGRTVLDSRHEGTQGEYVSLCVFEQGSSVFMPFLAERGVIAEISIESSMLPAAPTPKAHDPPAVDPAGARAPPA